MMMQQESELLPAEKKRNFKVADMRASFVAALRIPAGAEEKRCYWQRLRLALLRRFEGNSCTGDDVLPGGFLYSPHEADAAVAVTPGVLEALYERTLTGARSMGAVYTPPFLTRWMAYESVERWLESRRPMDAEAELALLRGVKVLDMAVGAGAFTMAMLYELAGRIKTLMPEEPPADILRGLIERNIYGADINAEALQVARDRFRYALQVAGAAHPERMNDGLICADATAMEPRGYDLVIGNPPYLGEKGNRELFERLKNGPLARYCSARMDYWYLFACVGLDALKPGGILHLVTPNKWLSNEGAYLLREKLTVESGRMFLSDFGAYGIFERAGVQTMCLLAEKSISAPDALVYYRRFNGDDAAQVEEFLKCAPYGEYRLTQDCVRDGLSFCSPAELTLLRKMESLRNFQLDAAQEVGQGIVPNPDVVSGRAVKALGVEAERRGIRCGDGVFVVPKGYFKHLSAEERQFLKPLYEPSGVEPFSLKEPKKELIYLTVSNGAERATELISHLEKFRPLMEARRETRMGRMRFYHLHWPRRERFFLPGPKILAPRKCARPTFTYTEREAYVMMAFNVIMTPRIGMKYLSALLNSRLMRFWFRKRGKMQGDMYQIDAAPLLRAPLYVPAPALIVEAAALFDAVCARYGAEKEAALDELIERIYGLTDEERLLLDGM